MKSISNHIQQVHQILDQSIIPIPLNVRNLIDELSTIVNNISLSIEDDDQSIEPSYPNFQYYILEGPEYTGKTTLINEIFHNYIFNLISNNQSSNTLLLPISEPYNFNIFQQIFNNISTLFKHHSISQNTNQLLMNLTTLISYMKDPIRNYIVYYIKYIKDIHPITKYLLFMLDRILLLQKLMDINKIAQHNHNQYNIIILQDRSFISTLCYQTIYCQKYFTFDEIVHHQYNLFKKYSLITIPNIIYLNLDKDIIINRMKYSKQHQDVIDQQFIYYIDYIYELYQDILQNSLSEKYITKLLPKYTGYTDISSLSYKESKNMILKKIF